MVAAPGPPLARVVDEPIATAGIVEGDTGGVDHLVVTGESILVRALLR